MLRRDDLVMGELVNQLDSFGRELGFDLKGKMTLKKKGNWDFDFE